jgi:FkbM family methyltransferase
VGPSGCVLAIEAHPRTYLALLNNLKRNPATNVRPLSIAVGPEPGTVRFSDRLDDDWNKVDRDTGSLEVEVKPLDDVCDAYAHIDVLKIDVEGFELHVLKGSTNVLARTDCVLLECWSEHTRGFGYTPDDLISFMQRVSFYGYRLSET